MDSAELMLLQNEFTGLLRSVKREGMEDLIEYLATEGFFTAPASSRFHSCYEGGLLKHSLDVTRWLTTLSMRLKLDNDTSCGRKPLEINSGAFIIAGLLHDVCKVGAYVRTKKGDGFTNKKGKDKGHGCLSVERIQKYIKLTKIEELMIRFHMGMYHCIEYDAKAGEYNILSKNPELPKEERYGKSLRNAWYHNPAVKLMSIADEIATLEEKSLDL